MTEDPQGTGLGPFSGGYFLKEFGIDEALCRKLLTKALSRGGDFADLYFEHSLSDWVGLEDGRVDRSYGSVALGVGIRTVKDDQVGYGFTQDLSEAAMLTAAATAASLVNQAPSPVAPGFSALRNGLHYPVETGRIFIPLKSKLPILRKVHGLCTSLSPLVTNVSASFVSSVKHILVVTSDGVVAEDSAPLGNLGALVVVERDGRKERSGWNLGGRREASYYSDATVETIARVSVNRALKLLDAVQPPAGQFPVVLGPGLFGVLLHEAIGHGMEGDFNRKGTSTYSSSLGRKVAEPFVTIVDDATVPNLSGSIHVDDEGTPGQRTVLVEGGILKGFLHDRISARHYGVAATGNGRRQDFMHVPIPRMRNTFMLAGAARPEDLIKEAGNGIYVEDVANGEVRIGEGDFSFYVSQGRLIENGRLGPAIKDVNIMGNGPKLLADIIGVADDLQMYEGGSGRCGKDGQAVPVSFGLPTCLVRSLTVGGVQSKGGRS